MFFLRYLLQIWVWNDHYPVLSLPCRCSHVLAVFSPDQSHVQKSYRYQHSIPRPQAISANNTPNPPTTTNYEVYTVAALHPSSAPCLLYQLSSRSQQSPKAASPVPSRHHESTFSLSILPRTIA